MAEPSLEYVKRICALFCSRYNELNKTNFSFDKIEKSQCDIDFYIKDGNVLLPIQYTIIQTTPLFLKSSAQTGKVTERLEEMGNRYGLKCTISLVFREVPISEEDISRFIRCFMIFLRHHLVQGSFKPRFKNNDDIIALNGVFNYLTEFEVVSIGDPRFALITGNEAWGYERTIDQDMDYHLAQILEKDSIYSPENSLILLLDVNPMPISGITLDELRKKCRQLKFNCKEIWQVNIGNDGFCDKIYPFTVD